VLKVTGLSAVGLQIDDDEEEEESERQGQRERESDINRGPFLPKSKLIREN
jgi:hypothetical protein